VNSCLEVDLKGLAEIYGDKPKTFIINELTQNAWDENIKECKIDITSNYQNGMTAVRVEDDSPEGFKQFEHVWTMFAHTSKRDNAEQRGRFNIGEKLVIALCVTTGGWVEIKTTKGKVTFDANGRHENYAIKTNRGSVITAVFKATTQEVLDIVHHTAHLLVPANIRYIVNGKQIKPRPIVKTFKATLLTDIMVGDVLKVQKRETSINLVDGGAQSFIYEMGIPIMETDCPWHIDVQQKVQLNLDRDNILPSYVQDLYAEVLNATHKDINEDQASMLWVRTAMKDDRCKPETVKAIMEKRFGPKFCIANPHDVHSMEKAISSGYIPVYGREMSREEWNRAKAVMDIPTSSGLFGEKGYADAKHVEPNNRMNEVKRLVEKIAKRILGINVNVKFVTADATTLADYARDTHTLRFNVGRLPRNFFDTPVSVRVLDLCIHEIGHEKESMTEYHELLTRLGAELVIMALNEPQFFRGI